MLSEATGQVDPVPVGIADSEHHGLTHRSGSD